MVVQNGSCQNQKNIPSRNNAFSPSRWAECFFFQRTSQKGQRNLREGRRRSEQCSPALIERQQRRCGLVRSCVALILAQEVFRHAYVPPACDPARGFVHSFPSPPFVPSLFFVSSVGKLRDLGYMQVTVKWNQRASNWTILDSAY